MNEVRVEEAEPGIHVVTIDRTHRRNALSSNVLAELHGVFDALAGDPAARVVVLTGEGVSFCTGADVKSGPEDADAVQGTPTGELLSRVQGDLTRTFLAQELMAGLFERVHRMRLPVIAAVNGHAHGGGFALALACDIRYAAESASFGAVFIKRGVSACDMGTSYHLPRLVGASRAAELMLTGRVFDAAEAREMALVLDVVPDGEVVERAMVTAREIASNPPLAVWMTKETMWQTVDAPSLRHALDIENRTQIMCTATGELTEAFAAFREGRPAEWKPL
ncbi:enoyl-CoA hydratase/isomerase family protein [Rhabdothermincola salaria]|uniref:enoyl-CoA hydratase/isomerase family protein n=1 Tax=Rhabdothermincola salaria TaxID=2903142 RepID=UPI001E2D2B82|nr:enoyl-CoA hydratase/isomerase family protein [Rhabdothermincola salaria]MCD9624068.1 enoyl-CoA hydratase/isomerase family protein [Rhabdothermincola salaria]